MWFKQVQTFQLPTSFTFTPESLAEKLQPFAFTSCLPSFASSLGWVAPLEDEGESLVHVLNGCIMLCLMIEEKILPASVVREELKDKIKAIEARDARKVRHKEKLSLKDDVTMTLLPRAFSRLTRIYAYIDIQNQRLILSTVNTAKTEQFISLLAKSIGEGVKPYEVKKVSPELTYWLKQQKFPNIWSIEKSCLLQDPEQQNRTIRCQNQDLSATSIQTLLTEGCEVKQLALSWHDRINFILADDFSLRSIRYEDEILSQLDEMEVETKRQQFDADFYIMAEVLNALIKDLLDQFQVEKAVKRREEALIV